MKLSAPCLFSFIVPVLGQFERIEPYLLRWFEIAQQKRPGVEFIFVFDGPRWSAQPAAQRIAHFDQTSIKTRTLDKERYSLGALYNLGIAAAEGAYLAFDDPRRPNSQSALKIFLGEARAGDGSRPLFIADPQKFAALGYPFWPKQAISLMWIAYDDLLPVSNFIFPAQVVRDLGGFDESLILQHISGWDFVLRAARNYPCEPIAKPEENNEYIKALSSYDIFSKLFATSDDLARRYLSRKRAPAARRPDPEHRIAEDPTFLIDLGGAERSFVERQEALFLGRSSGRRAHDERAPANTVLKIAIIGGLYEHHHNHLCFYAYFEQLKGAGFATYKAMFEPNVHENDVIGMDLVILSRLRGQNTKNTIALCKKHRIPTLFMIDDNWLTLGRDWPDFAADFSAGAPPFEAFLHAVRNCDATLTYNRLMVEDFAPIAKRIVTLSNSVDLDFFEATPRPRSDRFLIGYAGSRRFSDAPFAALAAVARARSDVDLAIFGEITGAQEKMLKGCKVMKYGFMPYEQYTKTVRQTGVDILLAPSDDSRTSRSKCPNKYFEITAAGAVGIYSEMEPYVWHVRDGINGRFVPTNGDENDWIQALNSLLDKPTLEKLASAARNDIEKNFSVKRVAEPFRELMLSLARGAERAETPRGVEKSNA